MIKKNNNKRHYKITNLNVSIEEHNELPEITNRSDEFYKELTDDSKPCCILCT